MSTNDIDYPAVQQQVVKEIGKICQNIQQKQQFKMDDSMHLMLITGDTDSVLVPVPSRSKSAKKTKKKTPPPPSAASAPPAALRTMSIPRVTNRMYPQM